MEKRVLSSEYSLYQESYPACYELLCKAALLAREKSYSPYSAFRVGAAVLLDSGEIVEGANQENASYPLGSCAERIALNTAAMLYPDQLVKAIAICGGDEKLTPRFVSPCGGCRQLFMEQYNRQGADFDVIMIGRDECCVVRASLLLPFHFSL